MIQENNFKTLKEILNFIDKNNLSKKFSIIRFEDTDYDLSQDEFQSYKNIYLQDVDAFIEKLKKERKDLAPNIYIKDKKDNTLPKLLMSIGYLINPLQEEICDDLFEGREKELMKMEVIFNKKIKNNLLIIGNPGVGKTSLVRAYVKCKNLKNVFVIECAKLIGNSEYRGSFEQKVVDLIDYAFKNNIILFFDELHSLIGLGNSVGGMSITDILKPYLINTNTIFIGATTHKEVNILMADEAFKRRFSILKINELDNQQLLKIKNRFDLKVNCRNQIKITDEDTIVIINKLESELKSLYFPDKLLDFLDFFYSYTSINSDFSNPLDLLEEYIYDYI